MLPTVIGIISYLPDNVEIRKARFEKLCKLIDTCNQLFGLPIYIVIQNYKDELAILSKYKNVTTSDNYICCGIVGARKKLREWFISSSFNCLIMLDDDCNLVGSVSGAKKYLEELNAHPSGFGEFRGSQLKLFSITKDIFSQITYDDINPEKAEGFEDTIFVGRLRKQFPDKKFIYNKNTSLLKETSLGAKDKLSTWYTEQNLKDMLDKTHKYVEEVNKL